MPAYRDGQVDCGMGRRDTERTGAGFLGFGSGERFVGSAVFFVCFVMVEEGGIL